MDKDFLTYNQQMKYLRNSKKIACNGSSHKTLLVKSGYFNLVNGYKTPFCTGKDAEGHHTYAKGTTIDELYSLKVFDDDLRILLFKYITKIEQEIRALSEYTFDNINRSNSLTWFNVTAYRSVDNMSDVIKLISKIYSELSKSKHNYVQNYLNNHKSIPTWIMIKVISFSNLIDFIDLGNKKIKDNLCELYGMTRPDRTYNHKLLIGSLQWLRTIRNSCDHNERVFDINLPDQRIKDSYFDLMAPSYNKGRNKTIIDAIIYFKYFLPHETFKVFIDEFKSLILDLKNNLQTNSFDRVRAALGIKNILHLDSLLLNPNNIMYNFHS